MKLRWPSSGRYRVDEYLRRYIPPWQPRRDAILREIQRLGEMDLGVRAKVRRASEGFPAFMHSRMLGGSGFRMSGTLRWFFNEYASRIAKTRALRAPRLIQRSRSILGVLAGVWPIRSSSEREHLLRADDYFDWYTSDAIPDTPGMLNDVIPEGVVHSYELLGSPADFKVELSDSELVIVGISLIRRRSELSAIVEVGELPPYPSETGFDNPQPAPGHEGIAPAEDGPRRTAT